MRTLQNNHGIALVTALMMTLISLTMVMALLYVVTQGVRVSGQTKKYHTSLDAAYGGAEIIVKDAFPTILKNYSTVGLVTAVNTAFPLLNPQIPDPKCYQQKLTLATASWPASCSKTSNPKSSPDLQLTLPSSTGNPFTVYSKIVDTVPGNTDTSGIDLLGIGVTEQGSMTSPMAIPYIYRVEIQGERSAGATTQANIEVLYAW
jgi:hypothetical protein